MERSYIKILTLDFTQSYPDIFGSPRKHSSNTEKNQNHSASSADQDVFISSKWHTLGKSIENSWKEMLVFKYMKKESPSFQCWVFIIHAFFVFLSQDSSSFFENKLGKKEVENYHCHPHPYHYHRSDFRTSWQEPQYLILKFMLYHWQKYA